MVRVLQRLRRTLSPCKCSKTAVQRKNNPGWRSDPPAGFFFAQYMDLVLGVEALRVPVRDEAWQGLARDANHAEHSAGEAVAGAM